MSMNLPFLTDPGFSLPGYLQAEAYEVERHYMRPLEEISTKLEMEDHP